MGQSKSRRSRFFAEHPYCCFCGGGEQAVEIEHMPSRTMFRAKHRPQGFEFPICKPCNNVSRKSEAVVAYLAMARYDLGDEEAQSNDLTRLSNFIKKNCPGTLEEILEGGQGKRKKERELQEKTGVNFKLVEMGKVVKGHLFLFGSKMSMAAYYHHVGKPLSAGGGVAIRVHTLLDAIEGQIPDFPDYLSGYKTLRQGSWDVASQFVYRHALTDDHQAAMFQFIFHDCLMITSFMFDDLNQTKNKDASWLTPGKIKAIVDEARNPLFRLSYGVSIQT